MESLTMALRRAGVMLAGCLLVQGCARSTAAPAAAKGADAELAGLLAQTNAKIEQFQFSPDGRRIAYVSSKNGSADIWVMDADGRNARAITSAHPEAEADPQWSPDGKWIAYVTHHCGTGCWADIFMIASDGSGGPINLSYGQGGPNPRWTPDGKSIVFVRYYGDNGFSQIGIIGADIPFGRPQVRYPTGSPGNEGDPQVSPDGKWLAFTAARRERPDGPSANGIWVMPLAGGPAKLMAERADSPRWSPDGAQIAFVSSASPKNIGVAVLATHDTRMLTHDAWDNGNPKWSPDGKSIAFVANRKWNFRLMKMPAAGGAAQPLSDRPGVVAGLEAGNVRGTFQWAPDGGSIVYTFMDHGLTSDLWRIPASGGAPQQLTNHMPAGLARHPFVAPALVTYKSKGDVDISAFLYTPRNLSAGQRAPLLLYAHSFGDGGMFVNGFYPFVQYFVSRGFVVIAPEDAKRGEFGGTEIDDLAGAIDYADHRGLIDRRRVVMQGGSTGGYRTMQMTVRYPDALQAAVNLYGPTDVVELQKFFAGTRRRALFGGADATKDAAYWRERSATPNVGRIKTPLLLLWADRDLGVPTSQAEAFHRAATEQGKAVEYVSYSNESHGWYTWRPATLKDAIVRVAAHYDKHLGRQ